MPEKSNNPSAPRKRFLYNLAQRCVTGVSRLLFGLHVEGLENIPASGSFILACNHQSWFDPPLVGSSCPREIHFAAKVELFRIPLLGRFIKYLNSIPVRRKGFDRSLLNSLDQLLSRDEGIIIFPEGTRHLDGKLRPPKAGIGMLAVKHPQTPIVPVYIHGSALIHRKIGSRNLRVRYGKPFTVAELKLNNDDTKKNYRFVANYIMQQIAVTGQVNPPDFAR